MRDCGTVVQYLALSAHSKKVLGLIVKGFLYVLPVPAWVISGYSGWLIGHLNCPKSVNGGVDGCLSR